MGIAQKTVIPGVAEPTAQHEVYDRRKLTYSETFDSSVKRTTIRVIEWMTGKIKVLRRVRVFERAGAPKGPGFWGATMKAMGIDVQTPIEEIENIPATGPVVLVANHPHGLIDGMVLAYMIGKRRGDYRILTRSLLTGLDESARHYMISVPFPHQPDAQERMIEMRTQAMEHLADNGLIALFPSGVVAAAETAFGPAVEAEWNVFTAKLIRLSGASVVPVYFSGANSRWYHVANKISATFRQGLLIHEIVHAFDKPQRPIIGKPIAPEQLAEWAGNPRGLMQHLRARTLELQVNRS